MIKRIGEKDNNPLPQNLYNGFFFNQVLTGGEKI